MHGADPSELPAELVEPRGELGAGSLHHEEPVLQRALDPHGPDDLGLRGARPELASREREHPVAHREDELPVHPVRGDAGGAGAVGGVGDAALIFRQPEEIQSLQRALEDEREEGGGGLGRGVGGGDALGVGEMVGTRPHENLRGEGGTGELQEPCNKVR